MGGVASSLTSNQIQEIYVHFESKKLRVVFQKDDYNTDKKIPLQKFRTKIAKVLNVPATSLLLYKINPQKQLTNMGATLEDYGIKNNGELLVVREEVVKPKPQKKTPQEEINDVVNSVESELGNRIRKFIDSPPKNAEELDKENRVLCEVILAKTISLDNVEVSTPEERLARKQAVAELQGYHQKIDEAMKKAQTQTETKQETTPTQETSSQPQPKPQAKQQPKKKNNKKKKGKK